MTVDSEGDMADPDDGPQIIDSGPVLLHATVIPEPDEEDVDGGDRSGAGE